MVGEENVSTCEENEESGAVGFYVGLFPLLILLK